jgi:hypothetical protein
MALVRGLHHLTVAVGAAVWSVALPANACDCRRLPEPSPAIATEAAFIVAGRVLEIRERREHLTIERDGSAETSVRTLRTTPLDRAQPLLRLLGPPR